jgi:hypothetical protein
MTLTSLVFGAGGTYGETQLTLKKHFRKLLKKQNDFYKYFIFHNIKMSSYLDIAKSRLTKLADKNPNAFAALKNLANNKDFKNILDTPVVKAAISAQVSDTPATPAALATPSVFKMRSKKSARKSKSPKKSKKSARKSKSPKKSKKAKKSARKSKSPKKAVRK